MEEGTATTAVPQGLGASAVELLGRLIQANTVNPPGNEGGAQELLHERLTTAGFECELLEAEPDRPNLVARLRGARTARRSPSSATSTPFAPTPTSGPSTPGPATSSMAGSVVGALWT